MSVLIVLIHCGQTQETRKAVVSIKPGNQVFWGENVNLRCDLKGGGDTEWTYSWFKENSSTNVSSGQEYNISSVGESDSGEYTCRGTVRGTSRYSQISDAATLTVTETPKPELSSSFKGAALIGNPVTLYCKLDQSAGWRFYWSKHSQTPENDTTTRTPSYTIRSVSVSDGGQYWCRAGRGNPVYYTNYSDALWVNITERAEAVLSIKPNNQVFRGESVTLRCDVQGGRVTEWTYSWNRSDYTHHASNTSQEYRISSVTEYDSGKYSCRGERRRDSLRSEISNAVTLTVSETPKPELSSSFKGAALIGNPVTLYCELNQSAGWRFYWSKHTQTPENETTTWTPSYTISSVNVSDGGQYWCRAGRGNTVYYTNYSDALWVNVTESPHTVVSIKPDNQVFRGETVTLRCDLQCGEGDTEWTYTLNKDGNTVFPLRTSQEFRIGSVTDSDSGDYTCRGTVRGTSGSSETSPAVRLTVSALPRVTLTVEPSWRPMFTGESVTLKCGIQSHSDWTYQWYKGSSRTAVSNFQLNTFIISSTADQGQYWCRGERDNRPMSSQESNPVTLTVRDLPRPTLTVEPDSTVFTGESVSLKCEIDTHDGWTYQWYKQNNQRRWSSVRQPATHTVNRDTLTIRGDAVVNGDQYRCRGERHNRAQLSYYSNSVTLTVKALPRATLTVEPRWRPVFTGESVTLKCGIQSHRNWRYQWYKGSRRTAVYQSQLNTFTIISSAADQGQYWCRGERAGRPTSSQESNRVDLSVKGNSFSVLSLLSSLIAASPYLLVSIILGVQCYRARAKPDEVNSREEVVEAEDSC
ncbi:cell adhesion molecule CEACAM5-like [Salminus brasiliensis]|uniref:cell adhesion molecule CEACAM5-like n=1 Tax=Salminus brasiliensis TaxID=930266 RepID=UPI003B831B69